LARLVDLSVAVIVVAIVALLELDVVTPAARVGHAFVGHTIAIVVAVVARLRRAWVHTVISVITVDGPRTSVIVAIQTSIVDQTVAVVVQSVARSVLAFIRRDHLTDAFAPNRGRGPEIVATVASASYTDALTTGSKRPLVTRLVRRRLANARTHWRTRTLEVAVASLIRFPIAVVVEAIAARLDRRRGRAFEARIAQTFVNLTIAIVVNEVAHACVVFVDRGHFRFTIQHVAVAVAHAHAGPACADALGPAWSRVASHAIAGRTVDAIRFIRFAVAVVVDAVATTLEGTGMHQGIAVVTVRTSLAAGGQPWLTIPVVVGARARADNVG